MHQSVTTGSRRAKNTCVSIRSGLGTTLQKLIFSARAPWWPTVGPHRAGALGLHQGSSGIEVRASHWAILRVGIHKKGGLWVGLVPSGRPCLVLPMTRPLVAVDADAGVSCPMNRDFRPPILDGVVPAGPSAKLPSGSMLESTLSSPVSTSESALMEPSALCIWSVLAAAFWGTRLQNSCNSHGRGRRPRGRSRPLGGRCTQHRAV